MSLSDFWKTICLEFIECDGAGNGGGRRTRISTFSLETLPCKTDKNNCAIMCKFMMFAKGGTIYGNYLNI